VSDFMGGHGYMRGHLLLHNSIANDRPMTATCRSNWNPWQQVSRRGRFWFQGGPTDVFSGSDRSRRPLKCGQKPR
jgi:hypothetical protein